MSARSRWIAVVLCVNALLLSAKISPARLKETKDGKYKPGQVWSYKTRPGEEGSTLTVLRIESTGKETIVHIRVDDVHLRNCFGGNAPEKFEHMPFAREALNESVVAILRTGNDPDYQDGYFEWRKAWDEGKAGFYSIALPKRLMWRNSPSTGVLAAQTE